MIIRVYAVLVSVALCLGVSGVAAQSPDDIYVRIEARSSLAEAEGQLRLYASDGLDNLNGFRLGSVWYGMALGPYADEQAARADLTRLRAAGRIPSDSFITTRGEMGARYWPAGTAERSTVPQASEAREGDLAAALVGSAAPDTTDTTEAVAQDQAEDSAEDAAAPQPTPEPAPEPEETRAEKLQRARQAEAELSRDDKRVLQSRLQWAGFYNSSIDGLFGRGTRGAITAWQEDRGLEPLGVMLPEHMAQLEREFFAVFEGLDMQSVRHDTAGVTLDLPMAVLSPAQMQPPFVIYEPAGQPEAMVVIISQAGGRDRLSGLYRALQSLSIIPPEGERGLSGDRFTITGQNAERVTYAEAETNNNEIKGFILVWPTGDEERRTRLIGRMQDSFTVTQGVLGERAAVAWSGREALLSGLAVRQPIKSGSGSYVSSDGQVLSVSSLVTGCSRITLGRDHAMRVVAESDTGLALLATDDGPLAPLGVLSLGAEVTAPADVAVSGFSFGGRLNAASVTFGSLMETGGLDGEDGVIRLNIGASNSDTGGPVLARDGRFAGVLMPANTEGGRLLPDQVRFAADRSSVMTFLEENGIALPSSAPATEDLVGLRDYAQTVTAQISCWE